MRIFVFLLALIPFLLPSLAASGPPLLANENQFTAVTHFKDNLREKFVFNKGALCSLACVDLDLKFFSFVLFCFEREARTWS